MTLTVACVLRSGGRYDARWVEKLRNGVARNLSAAYQFVCLADVPVPCDRIPLETDWPHWWSKIELFRPGLFDGRVLFFDLDTVITGPLDQIAAHPHRFTMVHEYYRPQYKCSTAMCWEGDYSGIWHRMCRDPLLVQRTYARGRPDGRIGDQAFIEDILGAEGVEVETFRDLFGEKVIASYKEHARAGLPAEAVAVAFHGRPKPPEVKDRWVRENWT